MYIHFYAFFNLMNISYIYIYILRFIKTPNKTAQLNETRNVNHLSRYSKYTLQKIQMYEYFNIKNLFLAK